MQAYAKVIASAGDMALTVEQISHILLLAPHSSYLKSFFLGCGYNNCLSSAIGWRGMNQR